MFEHIYTQMTTHEMANFPYAYGVYIYTHIHLDKNTYMCLAIYQLYILFPYNDLIWYRIYLETYILL